MNKAEKKNYIYNVIYRLSICLLPFFITPYIARVIGAEGVGLYSFSSTVALYFIMFAKLGLDNYGNRSIAACRDNEEERSKTFLAIYIMQIITSVFSILIYIFLVVNVFKDNQYIYWIQLLYVMSALFDVSWFFYGMEKFRITTIRSLISRMLIIVFVYSFVRTEDDLWIYALIMSASFLFEQLQLIPFIYKHVKITPLKKDDIISHIMPNIKLFIPLFALSIYNWMDKIMIGVMVGGTATVAFYTYAENIITLPKGIISALDTVMLPSISNLVANNHLEDAIKKMRNSIAFNIFLSCGFCFGIAGIAPTFVPWFLGKEFSPTIILTIQLAITIIPMSISSVIQVQYLIPFKKENIYIKAVALGALSNLILNLILIPWQGASGAVIATIVAESLVCIYLLINIRDVYPLRQLFKRLIPLIVCGFLEFAVIYLLSRLTINIIFLLFIQLLIGGIVYLAGYSFYLIYIRKEYSGLRDLINFIK